MHLETDGWLTKFSDKDRHRKAIDIMSAVRRALYQAGVPGFIRLANLAINGRGTLAGATTAICAAEVSLRYKHIAIRAARTECPGITDITTKKTWKRVKIHDVPLERYIRRGSHGTEKLREVLMAENDNLVIPMVMRWLGCLANINERLQSGAIVASSVTLAVQGEEMARQILRDGVRLFGRYYRVEEYLEARPDAMCGVCFGWGHIEATCASPTHPRCTLCSEGHRTSEQACTVKDCRAGRGMACVHVIAKCPNCRGAHRAESSQCPKRQEAMERGRRWWGRVANVQPVAPTTQSPPQQQQNEQTQAGTLREAPPIEDRENMLRPRLDRPSVSRHCPCHPVQQAGGCEWWFPQGGAPIVRHNRMELEHRRVGAQEEDRDRRTSRGYDGPTTSSSADQDGDRLGTSRGLGCKPACDQLTGPKSRTANRGRACCSPRLGAFSVSRLQGWLHPPRRSWMTTETRPWE